MSDTYRPEAAIHGQEKPGIKPGFLKNAFCLI
jgi:hypothetical protein